MMETSAPTTHLNISFYQSHFPDHSINSLTISHSTGMEWHKWFNYEQALEQDYGFTRLLYNFSLRKYHLGKENWRLNTEASYAVNPVSGYYLSAVNKRLNAETSLHYAFPFMNNVFLMAAAG